MVLGESAAPSVPRLTRSALVGARARGVRVPTPRVGATPTIAHLGVGVFHRAHQAVYAQDLLDAGYVDATEVGVSMRNPGVRDDLAAQDGLYGVGVMQRGDLTECRVIDAIDEVWVLDERPRDVVARLSDPAIRVVTITITEAGYHWSTSPGSLDTTSPAIRADLACPDQPRTMPGLLTAVAARRRAERVPPLTVVSCDNLVANGALTRRVVTEFASLLDGESSQSITDDMPFCSTMVDRMVPTPTPTSLSAMAVALGAIDRAAVVTEPFRQWVVEAAPDANLPPWDEVGVEFVEDVRPYEEIKLRVLNATHTVIAVLGAARGHATIADAYDDPSIRQFTDRTLRDEVLPSIARPCPIDLEAYVAATLERFADPSLGYTVDKVLSGGGDKIAQRIVPILRSALADGRSIDLLCFVIATWLWTVAGARAGVANDPTGTWIADRADASTADGAVAGLFDRGGPGGDVLGDLVDDRRVLDAVTRSAHDVWLDPAQALDRRVARP